MARVWLDDRLCQRGDLPDVCLKCGRSTSHRVARTFNWNPPWVWVTILAGLLPYVIVAMVTRKTVNARLPLCDEHKGHWWKRTVLVLFGLFAALGVLVLVLVVMDSLGPGNQAAPFLALLIPVAFLAWLVAAIVIQATAIRASEIDDERGLELNGVCQEFVDAYREEYGDRPRRVDRRALERWDDRDPPRRSRPAGDDDRRYREEDEDDRPRRRDRYRDEEEDDRRRPRRDDY